MCGLAGLIIGKKKDRSKEDFKKIREDFSNLMVATQVRGTHATGAFVLDAKKGIRYYKLPVPASRMVKTGEWFALLDMLNTDTVAIIGHVRFATKGSTSVNENNHPIVMNNIIGVHNGIITNDCELCEKYPYEQEVDSAAVFATIEHFAKKSRVSTENIAKALPKIKGNFAIMLADNRRTDSVFIARDGSRPIVHYKDVEEKLLWLSSTGDILRKGLKRAVYPTMLPPYSVARLSVAHADKSDIKTISWWEAPKITSISTVNKNTIYTKQDSWLESLGFSLSDEYADEYSEESIYDA